MSRIGRSPILLPAGVSANVNNNVVTVRGPKGTLNKEINDKMIVNIENNHIHVINNEKDDANLKAIHGLSRQLIKNMVEGVSHGFEKKLTINGVGYKVSMKGANAVLNIGYSHPVEVKAIAGITLEADKNTLIVKGIDKELVGKFASSVRDIKPVEPYHAYGISYIDEVVRRKETKTGKK
jgi:large subunit ribosomal protein L6